MAPPKLLSRDAILAVDDRPTEVVEVPEWGGSVKLRGLSGAERDQYETSFVTYSIVDGKPTVRAINNANIRARLVSLSVVDEDGKRLFSEADLLAVGDKSANVLDRLFEASRRLSGLSADDVERLEAGLEQGRNGSSGSGSPATSE